MAIQFRLAEEKEVSRLTEMSRHAFDSDIAFGGGPGGPTGYDSYEFHLEHQKGGRLYSLFDGDRIVAGAILKEYENFLYIYRIFVNPEEFHKGYGLLLMQAIEERFPACRIFRLDTPEWNNRTNSFYKKCGYLAVGKEHTPEFDLVVYEKSR